MKTNWTKRIATFVIVTLLTLVAAWSLAAQQSYTFTYDGNQYTIGGAVDATISGYRVIPPSNYKAYRMGARDVPYVQTSVNVAPTVAQVITQVPVEKTVMVQKTEPQVVAKVAADPITLEAGAAYEYNAQAYAPTFSEVQVQTPAVVSVQPAAVAVALPTVAVQGVETYDVQEEFTEDTNEQQYEQNVNHYHEINRRHTHNYLHNLKQIHNHYYNVVDHHQDVHYTTESIEQHHFGPTYSTVYNEPIIHEAVRDEAAEYEVVGIRTYEVPVKQISYQPVVTNVVTPGFPLISPIAYGPSPAGAYPGYYAGPVGAGWSGNWKYASNWR